MNRPFNFRLNHEELLEELIYLNSNSPKYDSIFLAVDGFLHYFSELPNLNYVAYYTLNTNTYEFELLSVNPNEWDFERICAEYFEFLLENGTIGMSMQTKSMASNLENEFDKKFLVCPLISFSTIRGVLILCLDDIDLDNASIYYYAITLICSYFANVFENVHLVEAQDELSKTMEQRIAERTMKLLLSKTELHEKFAGLRNNLIMSLPHEIRTPIGMIKGNSEFLANHISKLDEDDIIDISKDINESASRINNLFENYIYFANLELTAIDPIDLDKLQLTVMPSYSKLIIDLANHICNKIDRAGDLKINLHDSPICFSENYLNKFIREILDNALKYSEKDTPIIIETIDSEEFLILSVTNSGRGMTKEQISSVDAYIQFNRNQYEQQGMGLGLAIARRIADLHNCEFAIESEPNSYTKVNIKIKKAVEEAN